MNRIGLSELFPEDIESDLHVQFDPTQRRVAAAELLKFRGLALSARRVEPPPADAAARLLAEQVIAGNLTLKDWDDSVDQWILRLNLLAKWCPEFELPPITDEDRNHLIEQLCHGAFGYKDIKERDVKPVVKSWLSAAQHELLNKHAPERLSLLNGRTPKVVYAASNPPHIALRNSGALRREPDTEDRAGSRAGGGAHPDAGHETNSSGTQDIASFWREQYPKIKPELSRKYPKHLWR